MPAQGGAKVLRENTPGRFFVLLVVNFKALIDLSFKRVWMTGITADGLTQFACLALFCLMRHPVLHSPLTLSLHSFLHTAC